MNINKMEYSIFFPPIYVLEFLLRGLASDVHNVCLYPKACFLFLFCLKTGLSVKIRRPSRLPLEETKKQIRF